MSSGWSGWLALRKVSFLLLPLDAGSGRVRQRALPPCPPCPQAKHSSYDTAPSHERSVPAQLSDWPRFLYLRFPFIRGKSVSHAFPFELHPGWGSRLPRKGTGREVDRVSLWRDSCLIRLRDRFLVKAGCTDLWVRGLLFKQLFVMLGDVSVLLRIRLVVVVVFFRSLCANNCDWQMLLLQEASFRLFTNYSNSASHTAAFCSFLC